MPSPCGVRERARASTINTPELRFDLCITEITYPDEAYSWRKRADYDTAFLESRMRNGIVDFIKPEDCVITKALHEMPVREFGDNRNFFGTS